MHTHLYTHICIHIYTKYTHSNSNAYPYLNIPIIKNHIRYNICTEKYVDLYLYNQLKFDLLEKSQFTLRF